MPTGIYPRTKETRKKMSRSHLGVPLSEAHCKAMSKARIKQYQDPEHRKIHKDALNRPEVRKAMSDAHIKNWQNSQIRKNYLDAMDRPEVIQAKSIAHIENWKSLSYRKNVIDAQTKYYGGTDIHYTAFRGIHNRSRDFSLEVDSEFSCTTEGYNNFVEYLGPIPSDMKRPSVGRRNHDLGYIRGNFRWQEWLENSLEALERSRNL